MQELNCNIWADVDFGRGPVEVRCTRTDKHERHICTVTLEVDKTNHPSDPSFIPHQRDINHRNIFEGDHNVNP